MNKNNLDILYGIGIGIVTTFIGCFLFIELFTAYPFLNGFTILKSEGKIGKIITLGAVLSLITFLGLLKLNKEQMAKGVVISMILLAIFTLFI
jgi:hypothetical protein